MSTESELALLTTTVSDVLDVFSLQKSSVDATIAAAVIVSQNATQAPLVEIASGLLVTQTTFINYISSN